MPKQHVFICQNSNKNISEKLIKSLRIFVNHTKIVSCLLEKAIIGGIQKCFAILTATPCKIRKPETRKINQT